MFKRIIYRKDIERTCLNKLTNVISSAMEKVAQNLFLMPAILEISKKRLINK